MQQEHAQRSSPFATGSDHNEPTPSPSAGTNPLDDRAAPHPMAKRWVPYKHSNGVAIYYHENVTDQEGLVGGEYMVSSIVRGTPEQCLAALTNAASTTTILGPAVSCRVLRRDGQDTQVLHVTLAPYTRGLTALCAPRQAVVQMVLKKEPSGIHMLMFNSLPADEARALLAEPGAQQVTPGDAPDGAPGAGAAATGRRRGVWLKRWVAPALAVVRGGYTISGLEGFTDDSSPESLITCIMKVDLGGILGERSWLGGIGSALGLTERLTERMLTAVILIKDEVEQQRFKSYPFALIEDEQAAPPAPQASTSRATSLMSRASRALSHTQQQLRSTAAANASGPSRVQRLSSTGMQGSRGPSVAGGAPMEGVSGAYEGVRVVQTQGSGPMQSLMSVIRTASLGIRTTSLSVSGSHGLQKGISVASAAAAEASVATHIEEDGEEDDYVPEWTGTCNQAYWQELHRPGQDAPFKVRGPTYLRDKVKMKAGPPEFSLSAVDLVTTHGAVQHVARYLRSVRKSRAAFSFVVNLAVPSPSHVMNLVMTFSSSWHPRELGDKAEAEALGWRPFDHVLHRFIHGSDDERSSIFKLIPHVANGSWLVQQSVGTTPVMMGRKLKTSYHLTDRYMEVDFDVTSCKPASYIVGMVKGITTSLVVDMSFVLEGSRPSELPEVLLGAIRYNRIDLTTAVPLDMAAEIPMRRSTSYGAMAMKRQ